MKVNISENYQTFCKNGSIEHSQKNVIKEKPIAKRQVVYICTKPTAIFSAEKLVAALITAASIGIAGLAIIKNKSVKEELKKTAKKLLETDKKLKDAQEKTKQKVTVQRKTECVSRKNSSSQEIKKEKTDLNQNNQELSHKSHVTNGYIQPENPVKPKEKIISSVNIKNLQNQGFSKRDFFSHIENFISDSIECLCNFIKNL